MYSPAFEPNKYKKHNQASKQNERKCTIEVEIVSVVRRGGESGVYNHHEFWGGRGG